jgi:hypothetical protein
MKPNTANINNASGLTGHLPVKKSKVIMAACLITIMAFMWIRVFLNRKAEKNEANAAIANASAQIQAAQQQKKPEVRISHVPLPVVLGRNDVLTHDIFTAQRWKAFPTGTGSERATPEAIARQDADYINKIAETITLDAVIAGQNPEAFIGNNLVFVGSKLPVNYNDQIYEFTVTEIHETKVVLTWNDFTVDVEMSQSNESIN